MNHFERSDYLPLLILFVSFDSIRSFCTYYYGFFPLTYILGAITVICVFLYKQWYFYPENYKIYRVVHIYLLWLFIGIIRGMLVAENSWEWRQLTVGTFALISPMFLYVFTNQYILQKTLRFWVRYALTAFIVIFLLIDKGSYHYYLGPIFLLGCFWPVLPKKWAIIMLVLLGTMLLVSFGDRSQVIKAAVTLLIGLGYMFSGFIKKPMLTIAHWTFYIAPVVFLYLGISGIFNPFEYMAKSADGKYVQEETAVGQEDYAADTRTFIYEEVITSAVRHGYIWHGRTPARGNDSWTFGAYTAEEMKTGKYERHSNEVCHPNVFTWLGLIGAILYSSFYLIGSYLALYKSNSLWMKFLGVYIAFRWLFGWIEDISEFDISSISLWMMISMGFSESIRSMDNEQLQDWVLQIFKK